MQPSLVAKHIFSLFSIIFIILSLFLDAYFFSCKIYFSIPLCRLELRPLGIDVINVVPGAITSNLGNTSLNNYGRMPEWKLYKPFESAIRARAEFSQGPRSTHTDEFAKKTVAAVLKKNPPAWFSCGRYSTIAGIMYHLPLFIRDALLRMAYKC